MARRRSARLAKGAGKASEKASHAAPSLDSVAERDETPAQEDPVPNASYHGAYSSPPPRTPASSSPIKPPMSEMHPSKVHTTMAAAPSTALRLGFADIKPTTRDASSKNASSPTPAGGVGGVGIGGGIVLAPAAAAAAASTAAASSPSKATLPSSPFTFRFTRPTPTETGLSERAQKMMDELRGEAQKIKAELIAQREREREQEEAAEAEQNARRIARPKGKAGRFSAAHMAEFKKMDSIENHPSAFRALQQPVVNAVNTVKTTTTTLTRGVKRTQSKANLDDRDAPVRGGAVKATLAPPVTAASGPAFGLASPFKRANPSFDIDPPSAVKRARQRLDDDASSSRPISRDGSSIPRPTTAGKDTASGSGGFGALPRSHSTLASLMTPTKSSLAKAIPSKIPASGTTLKTSPSKASLVGSASGASAVVAGGGNGIKKSATMGNLNLNLATEQKQSAPVRSPGRFDRVKSILRGQKFGGGGAAAADEKAAAKAVKSALPKPSSSSSSNPITAAPVTVTTKTPSFFGFNKPLPSVPATTPSRKLVKRVVFTPEAKKAAAAAALTQAQAQNNSPSPFKSSGIPRSKTLADLSNATSVTRRPGGGGGGQISYPSLEAVMMDCDDDNNDTEDMDEAVDLVQYPDLSGGSRTSSPAARRLSTSSAAAADRSSSSYEHITAPAAVDPGTFTFRSDHTIRFGSISPSGFGASRGQASVRRVRPSSVAPLMPGSFPASIADLGSHGHGHGHSTSNNVVGAKTNASTNNDKENRDPVIVTAAATDKKMFIPGSIKHGLPNKKRHRPSFDEEDAEVEKEAAERAAKKRRRQQEPPVPEGEALLAPRLVGAGVGRGQDGAARKTAPLLLGSCSSPTKPTAKLGGFGFGSGGGGINSVGGSRVGVPPPQTPGTPSPVKKKSGLSLSRLNMLARPKMRK